MGETFSKLFSSITDSSVWSESHETVRVWITMLAMADQHGYVAAAIPGLAARARVDLHECEEALAKFLAPDPYSRSEEHEGRRIEKVDRGWVLLNYPRFRDMRDEEVRKTYERDRKRKQRAEAKRLAAIAAGKDVPDETAVSPVVPPGLPASAQAEADQDPGADPEAPPTTTPTIRSGPYTREEIEEAQDAGLPLDPGKAAALRDASHNSNVVYEIDLIRRQVEAETGETIGPLTNNVAKQDGLGPALAEYGLARVKQVAEFRARQAAANEIDVRLWRFLFSGDGFNAAEEKCRASEKAVARAREVQDQVEAEPTASPEERDRIGELASEVKFGGRK